MSESSENFLAKTNGISSRKFFKQSYIFFSEGVKYFVQRNVWVVIFSYVVFLVTYITLVCCSSVRRKYPANFIMLGIFTLALSYMTGAISSTYDTKIVFMAVGITAVICFLLSLFAMQTKVCGCFNVNTSLLQSFTAPKLQYCFLTIQH